MPAGLWPAGCGEAVTAAGFVHEALLYEDERSFLRGVVPFVTEGVGALEPTLVALPSWRLEQLSPELPTSPLLHTMAMDELGRNPGRMLPAWSDFLSRSGPGATVRGVGEAAWPGRTHEELAECATHEGLLNLAFAHADAFHLLCPYDVARLDPAVVVHALRTHPLVCDGGVVRPSVSYDPGAGHSPGAPLSPAPHGALVLAFDTATLRDVRRAVQRVAIDAGMVPGRVDELTLVVGEALSNSLRHGGGRGELVAWCDSKRVVCEIRDAGHVDDVLAGRVRPDAHREDGRGLWIIHQLSDLVQLRRTKDGQSLRIAFGIS